MTTIFIQADAFFRLESDLNSLDPNLDYVLMHNDGRLTARGQPVTVEEIRPDVAWLNVGLARAGLTQSYIRAVLESGTVTWLQTFNAGLDQPFYQDILHAGIQIAGSSAQAIAIAEYVIANVLAHYQNILVRNAQQLAHQWQRASFRELWHTRWLLVGFGNIGQAVAQRLRAFECDVIGVRRSKQPHPLARVIITLDELGDYLPTIDVVVLACTLTDQTHRLVNRAFFERLKAGATLVNIARGSIIDEQALIEALKNGTVEQAILDVFDIEPLPAGHPFWDMVNVTLTSHTSNSGSNTPLRGDLLFLENLRRYLADEPLLNLTEKRG